MWKYGNCLILIQQTMKDNIDDAINSILWSDSTWFERREKRKDNDDEIYKKFFEWKYSKKKEWFIANNKI